eukprot:758241-Hanusia_phi.AAC.1
MRPRPLEFPGRPGPGLGLTRTRIISSDRTHSLGAGDPGSDGQFAVMPSVIIIVGSRLISLS